MPPPLPVRRIEANPGKSLDVRSWPGTIPAVAQFLREGLEPGALTVLVGENGSGKSTVAEAIAAAYGLSVEGGSPYLRHSTRATESPLAGCLSLTRGAGASQWGFFLRAETMHGYFTHLEDHGASHEPRLHRMSHGESFLTLLEERFDMPGFYVLDEPEGALSFSGQLALLRLLIAMVAAGTAQAVVATHSPILASVPGARILEIGEWGWRETAWAELKLVQNWRLFLDGPERFLRHLR